MSISANKDKLSGTGAYSFTANGDAVVSLSALTPSAPQGAAGFTQSSTLPTWCLALPRPRPWMVLLKRE
jgi:hypothetical protein